MHSDQNAAVIFNVSLITNAGNGIFRQGNFTVVDQDSDNGVVDIICFDEIDRAADLLSMNLEGVSRFSQDFENLGQDGYNKILSVR